MVLDHLFDSSLRQASVLHAVGIHAHAKLRVVHHCPVGLVALGGYDLTLHPVRH